MFPGKRFPSYTIRETNRKLALRGRVEKTADWQAVSVWKTGDCYLAARLALQNATHRALHVVGAEAVFRQQLVGLA